MRSERLRSSRLAAPFSSVWVCSLMASRVAERARCEPLECETLKTEHLLLLEVKRYECDSQVAELFDGRIVVKDLATAYEDGDANRRGFHGGGFPWPGQSGLLAVGTLSGMTNAGILREPFEPACERCDQR